MKLLLIYATNSGSTEMAANEIMQRLQKKHEVTMKRVLEVTNEDIQAAEIIVLGSPSWDSNGKEGQPHDDFFLFKERIDASLFKDKPVAVFGCGDSSYRIFCGAVQELINWTNEWGAKSIAEPLKMDKYYYQLAQNQELIEKWTEAFPQAV